MRKYFLQCTPIHWLILLLALPTIQCGKDKPSDTLPAKTMEGLNTLGFEANGNVWVPFFECDFWTNPCGQLHASYNYSLSEPYQFTLSATRKYGSHSSYFVIHGFGSVTTPGNKFDSCYITYDEYTSNSTVKEYFSTQYAPGKVEIVKIDTVAGIISGELSVRLFTRNDSTGIANGTADSLIITNGRFDVRKDACICH